MSGRQANEASDRAISNRPAVEERRVRGEMLGANPNPQAVHI
jgi:hypothetical protein